MIENRPKNILCITIYRSNKVLNRQIRLAFAYIPEVDNLWKQKKNPSEGFNSPRRPARARCLSAHRLTWSYNTIWSSPLTNAYWYSEAWPYAMTPSTDQMLHHIMNLWPTFTFFILQYVSIEPLWTYVTCQQMTYSSGPMTLSHIGLVLICSSVETSPKRVTFPHYEFIISLG